MSLDLVSLVLEARRVFEFPSRDSPPPEGGIVIIGEKYGCALLQEFLKEPYFQRLPVVLYSPGLINPQMKYYEIRVDELKHH